METCNCWCNTRLYSRTTTFSYIYINDIAERTQSYIRLFADDTSLLVVVDDPVNAADTLNYDIDIISSWADR